LQKLHVAERMSSVTTKFRAMGHFHGKQAAVARRPESLAQFEISDSSFQTAMLYSADISSIFKTRLGCAQP